MYIFFTIYYIKRITLILKPTLPTQYLLPSTILIIKKVPGCRTLNCSTTNQDTINESHDQFHKHLELSVNLLSLVQVGLHFRQKFLYLF